MNQMGCRSSSYKMMSSAIQDIMYGTWEFSRTSEIVSQVDKSIVSQVGKSIVSQVGKFIVSLKGKKFNGY